MQPLKMYLIFKKIPELNRNYLNGNYKNIQPNYDLVI